jgi:hypothetical protein
VVLVPAAGLWVSPSDLDVCNTHSAVVLCFVQASKLSTFITNKCLKFLWGVSSVSHDRVDGGGGKGVKMDRPNATGMTA